MRLAPVPATILFASAGVAALVAERILPLAVLAAVLLAVCLRAPTRQKGPYVLGALLAGLGVFLISPLVAQVGYDVLWEGGPRIPVIGRLDITTEELADAALNGLRLTAVGLAFAAYALRVDHDRLLAAVGFAPRSALAVALATRLVPTLERDAAGLAEAMRGRGVPIAGARGYARLLSSLVAGSLERGMNLAEAMEARGFGGGRRTHAPGPTWTAADRLALTASALLLMAGVLWL